jgi:hypothetical protein
VSALASRYRNATERAERTRIQVAIIHEWRSAVRRLVRDLSVPPTSRDEVGQLGLVAVLTALETFDASKGVAFDEVASAEVTREIETWMLVLLVKFSCTDNRISDGDLRERVLAFVEALTPEDVAILFADEDSPRRLALVESVTAFACSSDLPVSEREEPAAPKPRLTLIKGGAS